MGNFSGLVRVSRSRLSGAVRPYMLVMTKAEYDWQVYQESLIGKNEKGWWIFKKDDLDRLSKEMWCEGYEPSDYGKQFKPMDRKYQHESNVNILQDYHRSGEREIYLNASEMNTLLYMEDIVNEYTRESNTSNTAN